MPTDIESLLVLLENGFRRKSWHGPNLKGSIRGLRAAEAAWRPAPGRRSIAEQTLHAAYWKYTVRRRILGVKRGSFAISGSNWFAVEAETYDERSWRAHVALLDSEHSGLRDAVEALDPLRLDAVPAGSTTTFRELIIGIAFHDVYHAGQIGLLDRLRRQNAVS
ncbi:MAG: DinB family protein [Isosphaeraceae bacterium]|nr:DinB family protein [Isosphaeraceae bacterium]